MQSLEVRSGTVPGLPVHAEDRTARALLEALRARTVRAVDLLEHALERAARLDARLGCLVCVDGDRARAAARAADAALDRGVRLPLLGLPMTVKDAFDVAGLPTTLGVPWMRGNVAGQDAALVARLRAAGAVVWGKTRTPLFSYDWQTASFGRTCKNPWDPTRGVGGSSGGSAAALAAGLTPLEIGSDVGGSIRAPAHACGVVGLRPTEGWLDTSGHAHVPGMGGLRSLSAVGPMARNVDDLALLLAVLCAQAEPAAPSLAPRQLRLGWCEQWGEPAPSREVREVLDGLIGRLQAAGAQMERRPLEPAVDPEEAWALWGAIHGHEVRRAQPLPLRLAPWLGSHAAWLAWRIRFGPGRMARGVAHGWRAGERGYLRARARREEVARAFEERIGGLDAWILPVWPVTAPAHQRTGAPVPVDGRGVVYSDVLGAYQCSTVLLGCPALALPAGRAGDGLPVGVQLLVPRGHDWRLLRVARAVEQARGPWTGLAPLES